MQVARLPELFWSCMLGLEVRSRDLGVLRLAQGGELPGAAARRLGAEGGARGGPLHLPRARLLLPEHPRRGLVRQRAPGQALLALKRQAIWGPGRVKGLYRIFQGLVV